MPRISSGQLLLATGVLHQLIGVIEGRHLFGEISRGGVIDSIGSDPTRMAWFWFLVTGFVLLVLGGLMHHVERRGHSLPASLGWQIGAVGVGGVILMPASGFWLLLPQAWWIVRHSSRQ